MAVKITKYYFYSHEYDICLRSQSIFFNLCYPFRAVSLLILLWNKTPVSSINCIVWYEESWFIQTFFMVMFCGDSILWILVFFHLHVTHGLPVLDIAMYVLPRDRTLYMISFNDLKQQQFLRHTELLNLTFISYLSFPGEFI